MSPTRAVGLSCIRNVISAVITVPPWLVLSPRTMKGRVISNLAPNGTGVEAEYFAERE